MCVGDRGDQSQIKVGFGEEDLREYGDSGGVWPSSRRTISVRWRVGSP